MKPVGGIVILFVLLCGCSQRTNQAKALRTSAGLTNEVELLLASLEGRPIWWSNEGTSGVASNRLVHLKHIAIPMLVDKISSLNFRDNAEVDKVGLACAILGTNAYSVLKAVAEQVDVGVVPNYKLPSEDHFFSTSGSLSILQLAGPCSFGPVIDVIEHEPDPTSFEGSQRRWNLKKNAMYLVDTIPIECMAELLRLYQYSQKSAVLRDFISSALREAIDCRDSNLMISVLKSLLRTADDFLIVEGLEFLKRCGQLSPELREEVSSLLRSSNAEISIQATNVMNLPHAAPQP